jgi:hypothetical protein
LTLPAISLSFTLARLPLKWGHSSDKKIAPEQNAATNFDRKSSSTSAQLVFNSP